MSEWQPYSETTEKRFFNDNINDNEDLPFLFF